MAAPAKHPMVPQPYLLRAMHRETADTFTVELDAGPTPMPAFAAGQFNMLYVFGVGEVPISISSSPLEPRTLMHTTRAVGAVTQAMGRLEPGDALGVRGPFGSCWPVERMEGYDVVVVAGGIGLAPLRPALYHILGQREKFGRVVLLYGTRTPADILFRKELKQWETGLRLPVFVTVDRATGSWRGSVGVVTSLIARAPFTPGNSVALVCGPEIMMRFSAAELERRGVRSDRIYVSMERNMKCAVGFCGHCQFGPSFVCKDGPVFRWDRVKPLITVREL
jgi:NAD(P)H-flavin reductase